MRPMPVHRGALKEHIKNTQHLRCKITLTKTNQKKKHFCFCPSNLKGAKYDKITPKYLGSSKDEMSTHIYYLSFPFNEQISIEPLTDFNSRLFIVAEVYEPWGILKLSKLLSTLVSKGCFESPSLSH